MIYTLLLNTADGQKSPYPDTYSNVNWRVNWDNLFQGANRQHSLMKVKIELHTTNLARSYLATNGYSDYNGYLTCNLSSSHQASFKGLNSFQYSLGGTILGLFSQEKYLVYSNKNSDGTTVTDVWCADWVIKTTHTDGVICNVPVGEDIFNISMFKGSATTDSPVYNLFDRSYIARLTFELL